MGLWDWKRVRALSESPDLCGFILRREKMGCSNRDLLLLAQRICGCQRPTLNALERAFRPLMGLAVQGLGRQGLVHWVRDQLASELPNPPTPSLAELTRRFCLDILNRIAQDLLEDAETVVGA